MQPSGWFLFALVLPSVLPSIVRAGETLPPSPGEAGAAAAPATYRGLVDASLSGTYLRQDTAWGRAVGGEVGVSYWPGRGVVDDGAPLSLQQYLQRPHLLQVSVAGQGSWSGADDLLSSQGGTYSLASRSGLGALSASGYGWVSRVRLGGSLSVGLSSATDTRTDSYGQAQTASATSTSLGAGLSLGVRIGTTELWGLYNLTLSSDGSGSFSPQGFGAVRLGVTWLLDTDAIFQLAGYNLPVDGVGGSFDVEIFPTARVGLLAGVRYEDGLKTSPGLGYSQGGLTAGVSVWALRRLELLLRASLSGSTVHATGSKTLWSEGLGLGAAWRFR